MRSTSRNIQKRNTAVVVVVSLAFLGVLTTSVLAFVLPTGVYGSSGPYDTVQVSNVAGQVHAFGGSLLVYASALSPPILVFNSTMPAKSGSIVDTLNIDLSVKNGTTTGYTVTCVLSATVNGSLAKLISCPSSLVAGVVPRTVSPIQLVLTGAELAPLLASFSNKTAVIVFSVSGASTVFFEQGCTAPPCPNTHAFTAVELSTVTVFVSPVGAIEVSGVSGGGNGQQGGTNQAYGGFGFAFCRMDAKC